MVSCGEGLDGELKDETQIVYVSPLKALSNDIHRNLEVPLAGIRDALREQGLPDVTIRTWVRTGDTPASRTAAHEPTPPHIVVTTPESLYILLGSDSGRAMLKTTRSVIVDEIHAWRPTNAVASFPVAGAATRTLRRPAASDRLVGHAKAHRRGGAFPRRRAAAGEAKRAVHDRRQRALSRAGSRNSKFRPRRSKR